MTTTQEAIAAYKVIARADGKSVNTVQWVCDSARYFFSFIGDDVALEDITTFDVRQWIAALRDRRRFAIHPYTPASSKPLSATSVNIYTRGMRLLFSTLVREEIIADHPVARFRAPKIPKLTIRPLSENQLKAVFKALGDTGQPLRNRALVGLLWDSCLRIGEAVGLKSEDVNLELREVKVLGKGNKERLVPLCAWTAKQMLLYQLKGRADNSAVEFFQTDTGDPMTVHALQQILRRVGERAGVRCNAHTFRHTGALDLVRNGLDPLRLQRMLGHTDLTMTRRYVLLNDSDLKETHRKFSPGDRLRL